MSLFENIGRARETCRITRVREYETCGDKVVLPARDYWASEVFLPEDCCRLRREVDIREKESAHCRFHVVNADSLQAAAEGENVLVMNFANAHVAGGGFWLGASAQEEALCRNSTLYASISSPTARAMYRANNWPLHAMETDAMIYSPSVAVFRTPSGELLAKPYIVSVVSVPAPNRRGLACLTPQSRLSETMMRRLVNVLCLARQKGHRRLVLGAWGCGAFGHHAENVAEYFRHVLIEEERHIWFDDVCFAIYGSANSRNYHAFQEVFHEFACR